ncbi:hypothetical protein Sjap_012325 [Stephania japonica]|uniref:Uncharacterized protein n=1 Tax=Stephania japonica TaxID=461633 RepID=A0AAP0NXH6_9MAGN
MHRSTTIINLIQLSLLIISASSLVLHPPTFCGKIKLQNNNNNSFFLNQILVCKSQTLYFRTSLGLFPISSLNYESKTLTISHKSCSSSLHYVSPKLLSLGLPTPHPNSLLLLNCSNQIKQPPPITASPHLYNCTTVSNCKVDETKSSSTCWFIKDAEKLEMRFHPKHLNCSHYARIYKGVDEKVELGTRVSFDLPDKLPNICDECNKPQGNCGVGLKCICHPKQCTAYLSFHSAFVLTFTVETPHSGFDLYQNSQQRLQYIDPSKLIVYLPKIKNASITCDLCVG